MGNDSFPYYRLPAFHPLPLPFLYMQSRLFTGWWFYNERGVLQSGILWYPYSRTARDPSKKGIYCMVYLHSFLLQFLPKRVARKKQFLMSVLTEQRLTKFQELPVICNAISSTMIFVNYQNLTNEILVRVSQRRLYLFRESFKSFYRSGSPIGPPECFRNCKSITLTFPGNVTMHFTGHRRWFPLF